MIIFIITQNAENTGLLIILLYFYNVMPTSQLGHQMTAWMN